MNDPTEYGKRLVPQILDTLASTEPDRIIYSIARFSGPAQEFRRVSARTFAQAVDKTAWWLQKQVGTTIEIQTVGYMGPRQLKTTPTSLALLF